MAKKAFVYDGTNWIDIAQSTADLSNYAYIPSTQFSFRNKIINGDFRINQRVYTSASNLASGAYGFDRWKSTFTNTTLTFTSAPQGQIVTINSGGSIEQIIERENMPAGTYVLSWTGTATGRVYNTGATPPSYAASPVLVTLDGTANVEVEFTASGGTRTLQNVQLEAGSKASAFEYRPIATEIALCQRYYEKSYNINVAPGTNTGEGAYWGDFTTHGDGTTISPILFKVTKRITPSSVTYISVGGTGGVWDHSRNGGSGQLGMVNYSPSQNGLYPYMQPGVAWAPVLRYGHWVAEAEL